MNNMKFFAGTIQQDRYYEETGKTRVVVKLTHCCLNGEATPSTIGPQHLLVDPPTVALRMQGKDVLKKIAAAGPSANPGEEPNCYPGGTIYFMARAIGEGGGHWRDGTLDTVMGLQQASIEFNTRRKHVTLQFAQPGYCPNTGMQLEQVAESFTPVNLGSFLSAEVDNELTFEDVEALPSLVQEEEGLTFEEANV